MIKNKRKAAGAYWIIWIIIGLIVAGFLLVWTFLYLKDVMFRAEMNGFIQQLGISSAETSYTVTE